MPEFHAKLSPSAADRWFACPGSVILSEGMPEKSSPFAEEGTQAHWVAEQILKHLPVKADPEMLENVRVYTDHVQDLYTENGNVLLVEKRVKVNEQVWGTADAIVWDEENKILYVRDLKYGAGVGVEVSDNLQLKIYALAALLTVKYPAKTINVGIVQPRFPHPDGPVRSKDYDAVDLMEFHSDLLDACKRVGSAVMNGDLYLKWAGTTKPLELDARKEWEDKYLNPTDKGCRWCLAAPICPKLKSKSQELAKQVFAPAVPYKPEDLAHTLDMLPVLEGWIKNVREFAYDEAEKGNAIPGYKLVEKRATRKWKEGVTPFELAKASEVPATEFLKPEEVITPAAAEKLFPKNKRHLLDGFCTKESSGHTLVHDSDKREAIRVDAKAAFATLPEVDPFS